MKNLILSLILVGTTGLSASVFATQSAARTITENAQGGYDFLSPVPIQVATNDFPAIRTLFENEFSGFFQVFEDRDTFFAARFSRNREALYFADDDTLIMTVTGFVLTQRFRDQILDVFPDMIASDFDEFNQGFSFSALDRTARGDDYFVVGLSLLRRHGAAEAAPENTTGEARIQMRITKDIFIELPPGVDMLTSQGLENTGPGAVAFTGSVPYTLEETTAFIVSSFQEQGMEPFVMNDGNSVSINMSGEGHYSMFSLSAVDDEDLAMTIIGGSGGSSE